MSNSLQAHGLQQARPPCSNSCPLSRWCHPTISSCVDPFSSCLPSVPASGSILMNWLFAFGGQSIGASASATVLSMNIQGWFPLGLTSLISLLSNGLSRELIPFGFTEVSHLWNEGVQHHQWFSTLLAHWNDAESHYKQTNPWILPPDQINQNL